MIYLVTDNCRNGHIQALMILSNMKKLKREELRLKKNRTRWQTGLFIDYYEDESR
ncbi:MAG: hypothetical protein ACLSXO_02190 [Coprococcus sp.]